MRTGMRTILSAVEGLYGFGFISKPFVSGTLSAFLRAYVYKVKAARSETVNQSEIGVFRLNRSTISANGCVLIFVYMTYTMLPVRLREALFGGLLLSIMHVYLSATCSVHVNWAEVISLKIHTCEKVLCRQPIMPVDSLNVKTLFT